MATAIAGTGGTFKSNTVEGQALEAIEALVTSELNSTANPDGLTGVTLSYNRRSLLASGTFDLPASQTIDGNGSLILTATNYLTGVTVTPGTNGTFKSTTLPGYVLEVLMKLQLLEQTTANNPNNRNLVTGSFNSETGKYAGNWAIPFTAATQADGAILFTATEYLID